MDENQNYLMVAIAEKTKTEDENKLYDYCDNFMMINDLDFNDIDNMDYYTINKLVSKTSIKKLKA